MTKIHRIVKGTYCFEFKRNISIRRLKNKMGFECDAEIWKRIALLMMFSIQS